MKRNENKIKITKKIKEDDIKASEYRKKKKQKQNKMVFLAKT